MENMSTIAAISTAQGTGGMGIVRLSGPRALTIAAQVFRPMNPKHTLADKKGYTGCLGRIYTNNEDIDDAIAFVYRAPRSYTGEDVVELSCHGGMWLVQSVLRLCLAQGAHPAQPGEFTKRAFLNGKLDLLQAEAVMDLIQAQGDAARRAALAGRDGKLSTVIAGVVENLVTQSAHLAVWADYPEEDIEPVDTAVLHAALSESQEVLARLLETGDTGRILQEGIRTAIIGRPNVGKSTLMNLLTGHERSIVTAIPGTTRDVVEESVRMGDFVLRLYDTAGIRETADAIESIGVEKSRQVLETADLVLVLFDGAQPFTPQDETIIAAVHEKNRPAIAVINKADLPQQLNPEQIIQPGVGFAAVVEVSAATGAGRGALEAAVLKLLRLDTFDASQAIIGIERQRLALTQAHAALAEALQALTAGMTYDAVNADIDFALDVLLELTGEKASERVIDEVFSAFCVGK